MTQRGATLLLGAVALWGFGRFFGVPQLYVAAAAIGVLVALSFLTVRLSSGTISARRNVGAVRLRPGTTSDVLIELRNDSRLPTGVLLVDDRCHPGLQPHTRGTPAQVSPRFVVPGIGAGRMLALGYTLHPRERGGYEVGPLRVRIRDPFGLCQRVQRYEHTNRVVVYPPIEPVGGGLSRGTHQGSETSDTRRLFNAGHEFYALREYVTGDDIRQVHWPSSAHRGKLMVRQLELPWQPEATLLCDTRRGAHAGIGPEDTLERAVSVAASLVWHLAERRYELRLLTEADIRPPQAESRHTLLDRLAQVGPSQTETLSPALAHVRGARAGGLLAAVVAPPPGSEPSATHPDTRALLQAGQRCADRAAFVVSPPAHARPRQAERAEELAAVLNSAGWKASVVRPGEPLAVRQAATSPRDGGLRR